MRLAPSILAADLADLAGAAALCERGGAALIHVDVMDGHFVPNLTFGIPIVRALHARTALPLDVHLMVSNPDRLLDDYLAAGAARIAVHWEAAPHLDRLLERIRKGGAQAGVAVNPATPVEHLIDILERLDYVLLMSVNPGFSGQAFIPRALNKARRLRALLAQANRQIDVAMDGGIDHDTIRQVVASGVETCVVGSAIFGAADPLAAMVDLQTFARSERK
jgi:ribulose-phosphate 3-epimerase